MKQDPAQVHEAVRKILIILNAKLRPQGGFVVLWDGETIPDEKPLDQNTSRRVN